MLLDAAEGVIKRTVQLIVTQRYILMNKPRLLRKLWLSYNMDRSPKGKIYCGMAGCDDSVVGIDSGAWLLG